MKPTRAIIHHSLTKDSETVSWSAIEKWHMGLHPDSPYRDDPMSEIGYHYGIELVGKRYQLMKGRDETKSGGHCKGRNHDSLGICFVGNFDLEAPSTAMLQFAAEALAPIFLKWQIGPDRIEPHSAYAKKSCPGIYFPMEQFVKDTVEKMIEIGRKEGDKWIFFMDSPSV